MEVPGEPLSLFDSGSENCICFGQILRIKLFYFTAISSLDPATNFRTHSMGTSTKDDDRAKILPGVEGDCFCPFKTYLIPFATSQSI